MKQRTKLFHLTQLLKKEIITNTIPVGSILPSIQRIQQEYNLSKTTVVGAVNNLLNEGIIEREGAARQGYRVVGKPEDFSIDSVSTSKVMKFILPFTYWNYIGNRIVETFEEILTEADLSLLFSNHQNSLDEERKIIERMLKNEAVKIDYTLFMTSKSFDHPNLHLLKQLNKKYPIILVDRYIEGLNCHYIGINNRKVGSMAAHHFIQLGHSDFAFITGFSRISTITDRLYGYKQAIENHGFRLSESHIIQEPHLFGSFDSYTHSGEILGKTILQLKKLPTAVFCGSDKIAVGLIQYFSSKGIKVPQDVNVIGCDNEPYHQKEFNRSITTFAYPFSDMAQEVIRLCDSMKNGKMGLSRFIEIDPIMHLGDTTSSLP